MTAYNPDLYTLCPTLQQSFLNKDTGDLLAGGYIFFYEDASRNTLQPIYSLTGGPPNTPYTVTALPNPLILSSIGTVVDISGNPVLILLYPYDVDGNISNYYVSIWSGDPNDDGVFQFDLQNIPGIGESPGPLDEIVDDNYILNGQFFLHNDIANDADNNGVGYISSSPTAIAPGGHLFATDSAFVPANSQQFVTFLREDNTAAAGVPGFPRYYANFFQTGTMFTGSYKDYRFRFPNVNMFTSDNDTPTPYTLGFTGYCAAGTVSVIPFFLQNFGFGGSAEVRTDLTSQSLTTASQQFIVQITNIPPLPGSTLGTLDDDYIDFGIGFPVGSAYDIFITDVFLTKGATTNAVYTVTSPQQDAYGALAGGFALNTLDNLDRNDSPNYPKTYDGSQLYLPVMINQFGFCPDYSVIGQVAAFSATTTFSTIPYLNADGQGYQVYGTPLSDGTPTPLSSSLGIPYQRIANYYFSATNDSYLYGTGYSFFSASTPASDNNVLLANNYFGSVALVSAGTITVTPLVIATSTVNGYNVISPPSQGLVINENTGVTTVDPSNTGTALTALTIVNSCLATPESSIQTTCASYQIFTYAVKTAAALTNTGGAGLYFQFESFITPNAAPTSYYVWYFVTNETDPVPGGIPIKVTVLPSDTAAQVQLKTQYALIGGQVTNLPLPAGSAITGGQYWTAESSTATYYFWYTVDGVGSDPTASGTGVVIAISSTDTNAEVATKTINVINQFMVGMPDLRGMFLRGFDNGRGIDRETAVRYSFNPLITGDEIGTFQYDEFMQHSHAGNIFEGGGAHGGNGAFSQGNILQVSGGMETRPYNLSVQYGIRY